MKIIKVALIILLYINFLYANDILDKRQKDIFNSKDQKGKIQGDLTKDSWVNPLSIQADTSKSKATSSSQKIKSNKISIGLEQDIFKSGAIYKTIKKGKVESVLNTTLVKQEQKELLSRLYGDIINLKKIDLEIKKLYYLINSKKIEIQKNDSSYINGLIDITILDESVIELSDLKNQKEDLSLQKIKILKEFNKYSKANYKEVDLSFLSQINLIEFIDKNTQIQIKRLQLNYSKLGKDIVKANYLPKVSVYGVTGYEDSDIYKKNDDYYNYGLKISIPLDFNSNKNKQIARLNTIIAKDQLEQTKLYEKSFYDYSIKSLKFIDNKIDNLDETINRYKNLYDSVLSLYKNQLRTIEDVQIMENRVSSSKLDKLILQLEKKAILNDIYSKI